MQSSMIIEEEVSKALDDFQVKMQNICSNKIPKVLKGNTQKNLSPRRLTEASKDIMKIKNE